MKIEETASSPAALKQDVLDLSLQSESREEFLDGLLSLIGRWTGVHSLGIRVLDWLGNIPYEAYQGFDQAFWEKENWLSVRKHQCLCPRVIMQNPDPQDLPGMTPGGSFICGDTLAFASDLPRESLPHYRGSCWKAGYRTLGIIPLRRGGEVLGAIQLADREPDALSVGKVEGVESLTPLISSMIQRFNTEDELRQNYETQAATGLLSRLSLEDITTSDFLDRALDIILSIPWLSQRKPETGCIFLLDELDPEILVMKTARNLPPEYADSCATLPFGKCLCGQAAATGKIIFFGRDSVDDFGHDATFPTPHGHYCVPILSTRQETMGVINIYLQPEHRHSDKEAVALTAIANTLAVAIQRKQAEEDLWSTNELLERMFASTGLLVAYLDTDFNFIRVNRTYAAKEGHEPEYYVGKNHFDLYPDPGNEEIFRQVLKTGETFSVRGKPFEYPEHPEWGTTYWDWSLQLVREASGEVGGLMMSLIETTERERAQLNLKRRTAQAESLVRAAGRLNAQLDLRAVLQAICEEATEALGIDAAAVSLINERQGVMRCTATAGLPPDFCTRMRTLPQAEFEQRFAGQDRLVVIADAADDGQPESSLYRDIGIRSSASAIIQRDNQTIGSLDVYNIDSVVRFSPEEISLLQGLADQAAMAIHNANLYSETRNRLDQMASLRVIDSAIAASLDLEVILSVFLDQVTRQLNLDAMDILLLDQQTQTLTFCVGRGFRTDALRHTHLRPGDGCAGKVVQQRAMVEITDLREEKGDFARSQNLDLEGFIAYHGIPLVAKGKVKGVLEIFHRRRFEPELEWRALLEIFAGQAAIAIDNATLFKNLEQSNIELSMAYDATLEGWSRALDLRDKETEGHTQRVTEMTVRLAGSMGITGADLDHVRRGALLHDIGKMGIPDAILLKPGPLTDEEWTIMRMHPVYAAQLLSPITFLRKAMEIPYCHHEKWDGSGYPGGLKGGQIPLPARIFAIVDVWDALSSHRPYRRAWPTEKVMEHLKEGSGAHFDPDVVAAFLKIMESEGGELPARE